MTPHLDRRTFLTRAGLAGAGTVLAAGLPRPAAAADEDLVPFEHGVASGDPLPDRVLLWTRVTPPEDHDGSPIEVVWRVYRDVELADEVRSGRLTTDASRDWTVKVDANQLEPFTYWFYRFEALGSTSLTGRTKTAPAPGQAGVDRLRIGVASCSNYTGGFFNAYARMAERNDLDVVLHLGDYLYEYGNGEDRYGPADPESPAAQRMHEPDVEMVTLSDYRLRHSNYKRDPDLRRLHQLFPFVTTWDDHETTNNSWEHGAANHNPDEPQSNDAEAGLDWEVRLADASRAYAEWMPVRLEDPATELYRSFRWGDLVDVVVMDTRIEGRDEQAEEGRAEQLIDSGRRMISQDQLDFVVGELRASQSRGTAWRLVAQQVMMMQLSVLNPPDLGSQDAPLFVETPDGSINVDQWDGYPAERDRLWNAILGLDGGQEVTDTVVLTGDIHTSFAGDLHPDPANPTAYDSQGIGLATATRNVGVEFVTPSITSENFETLPPGTAEALETLIPVVNPHIKFADLTAHGYNVLDVTAERIQSDWYRVDTVLDVSDVEEHLTSWYVDRGTERVVEAEAPLDARDAGPAVPDASATAGTTTPGRGGPAAGAPADTTDPGGELASTGGGTVLLGAAAIGAAATLRVRNDRRGPNNTAGGCAGPHAPG